nr:MAG TPA: hypothetical protein [Caudoviricetes sp.]
MKHLQVFIYYECTEIHGCLSAAGDSILFSQNSILHMI